MRRKSATRQPFCEIVVVGNELLSGKTLDTNSHWLANQITLLGGTVDRIVTVRDELQQIRDEVRQTLHRSPEILITVGGLGPTYDDKTLQGISLATRKPLRVNTSARRLVGRHYRTMRHAEVELTKHRIKMATIPRRATPLHNPVGTAPGIKLAHARTTIFALPGVPSEMKAIFDESIAGFVKKKTRGLHYSEFSFRLFGVMESTLAPLLDEVIRLYPNVYVKSHPQGLERGTDSVLELHFSTYSRSNAKGERDVMNAAGFLLRRIAGFQSPTLRS